MKKLKQTLAQRFYTYLCYDQVSDERFHSPSPDNNEHWNRVKKDTDRLADIAIKELKIK